MPLARLGTGILPFPIEQSLVIDQQPRHPHGNPTIKSTILQRPPIRPSTDTSPALHPKLPLAFAVSLSASCCCRTVLVPGIPTMKFAALTLAALLSLSAIPCFAAEPAAADPAQTVQSFYAYHFKHNMGFDAAQVKAQKASLDPKLYALITKVLAKPVPKGDAPDIEGDIFTDSQDTPL